MNIAEAKLHPEKLFNNPHTVYKNTDITPEDKIDILTSWKNQVALRALATQEGMSSEDDHTEIIKSINDLINLLTEKENNKV